MDSTPIECARSHTDGLAGAAGVERDTDSFTFGDADRHRRRECLRLSWGELLGCGWGGADRLGRGGAGGSGARVTPTAVVWTGGQKSSRIVTGIWPGSV